MVGGAEGAPALAPYPLRLGALEGGLREVRLEAAWRYVPAAPEPLILRASKPLLGSPLLRFALAFRGTSPTLSAGRGIRHADFKRTGQNGAPSLSLA